MTTNTNDKALIEAKGRMKIIASDRVERAREYARFGIRINDMDRRSTNCLDAHEVEYFATHLADFAERENDLLVSRLQEAEKERDIFEKSMTKYESWFTYTAELLGVEPTQKAVEDEIKSLRSLILGGNDG